MSVSAKPPGDPEIAELELRLGAIDWLARCGRELPQLALPWPIRRATARDDVLQWDPGWENVTLEARNDVHAFLTKRRVLAPQEWNRAARAYREYLHRAVQPRLEPALAAAGLAAETVGSNVTWNLQAAFLELHFARHRPPRFFGELVRVYEAGHLPCGWQGAWPSGSLIVW